MRAGDKSIFKMSEANILAEYASYLQRAILTVEEEDLHEVEIARRVILSFNEYKDYYMQQLLGKQSYLDTLITELQFAPE